MSVPLVKGWCPGAYRPMASGDGLVLRLRPPMGEMTPAQTLQLADLAERHGNGTLDLTNRASLQIRGVAEADHAALIAELAASGLVPPHSHAEGPGIILSPFAPPDDDRRQRRIAQALSKALQAAEFAALPAKFGLVLDTGPLRHLDGISGDLRIESAGDTLILRADGCNRGCRVASPAEAVEQALRMIRWFLTSGGVDAQGRGRMARHIAAGHLPPPDLRGDLLPNSAAPAPLPGARPDGFCLAAPFGQLTPDDLRGLARLGAPYLRITPWRMIFLPGLRQRPNAANLIADPHDPLLRVDACPGAPACPQATVQTRPLARKLAGIIPPGSSLHVTGCAKGCARQSAADLTLIGRDGRFDLLRHGTVRDTPETRSIAPDAVPDLVNR